MEVHGALTLAVLLAAIPTILALTATTAPYGRHGRAGWGPTLPGRVGWLVMECPTLLVFGGIALAGAPGPESVRIALAAPWLLHYGHRTLIYPLRLPSVRPIPASVVALAFLFQTVNSAANALWVAHLGRYDATWLHDPRFAGGIALFALGEAVNLHADTVLMRLRARGGDGYRIPSGGLYRWVSCPNCLGEMVAWTGWAIATWSASGVAFAVFTVANLVPRARANHRWYLERFPGYPRARRAVIPGLL